MSIGSLRFSLLVAGVLLGSALLSTPSTRAEGPADQADQTSTVEATREIDLPDGSGPVPLVDGGSVAGMVTDEVTGIPIPDVWVYVYDSSGNWVASDVTDTGGGYLAGGLASGTYFARSSAPEHLDELYDDIPCAGFCDVTAGTPISVAAPGVTSGIDLGLVHPRPVVDSEVLQVGGDDHVAVLFVDWATDATWVDVRKVSDGSLVTSVSFGSAYVGSDLEIVPAVAGDARLVVLGTNSAGAVRATVRETLSGALVGRANFGTAYSGDDLEVLAPNDLAVLGTHLVNQNVRVQIRTPLDAALGTVFLGNAWSGVDLEVDGPNVGVLGTKFGNDNVRVRTVSPVSGAVVDTAYWGNAFSGIELEARGSDWAVLQERLSNQAVRVQTRTQAGVKVGTANFGISPFVPSDLEVVAGDVAVLGTSTTNQAVRVQTRTTGGVLVGTASFGTAYSGIDLEAVGGAVGVLGVKGSNGKIRDQIRTTTGSVVNTLDYN